MTVRIGVFGTSWWTDAMYLPALVAHPDAEVIAVGGRDPERARSFADRWTIPRSYTDPDTLLSQDLDAVIVASANSSHHDLAMAALERGLDVLCEKPLALNTTEGAEMARTAEANGAITMVPFTYRYMPMNRWLKELIGSGYVGQPYHIGLRYFSGFAREGEYAWRFDRSEAGSGVIGDLGSHWLHLARWLLGEVDAIGATTASFIERDDRPDGQPYERGEDSAVMTVRFVSGSYGVLQVSAVCHEGGEFGQVHEVDIHGSEGTLHAVSDWDTVQEVRGVRAGEPGPAGVLPIPDHLWGTARRDRVHDTYRDVFRGGAMVGEFIDAVRDRTPCTPDFAEGLRVQELCDAAVASASAGGGMLAV